jgi:bifunctional ADP-heptose synthase (sugar kinase/adenylyltransferase)
VAKAVHELLDVADRVGEIGEQVREIAQTQKQNQGVIEIGMEKIQKQNKVTTFLIGPNHGEINKVSKLTIQNEEQIAELKELQAKMTDQAEIQKTAEQIQTLEKANLEVKDTLEEAQKTFSLFG